MHWNEKDWGLNTHKGTMVTRRRWTQSDNNKGRRRTKNKKYHIETRWHISDSFLSTCDPPLYFHVLAFSLSYPLLLFLLVSGAFSLSSLTRPATWTVGPSEQNQRGVLGLWRHASCCSGHRQQAGELSTGPARFIHQANERHCENPSLRKHWKVFWKVFAHHPWTCEWCLAFREVPNSRNIHSRHFIIVFLCTCAEQFWDATVC